MQRRKVNLSVTVPVLRGKVLTYCPHVKANTFPTRGLYPKIGSCRSSGSLYVRRAIGMMSTAWTRAATRSFSNLPNTHAAVLTDCLGAPLYPLLPTHTPHRLGKYHRREGVRGRLDREEEDSRLEEHREVFPQVGEEGIDGVHFDGGYRGSVRPEGGELFRRKSNVCSGATRRHASNEEPIDEVVSFSTSIAQRTQMHISSAVLIWITVDIIE